MRPRPSEWLLGGYATVVIATGLVRMARYPAAAWAVAAHGLLLVLLGLFQSPRLGPAGRLLRGAAPFIVLLALYGALDLLSGFGAERTYDVLIRQWERGLFGHEISAEWWRRAPSPFWSSVLHAAYFAYYFVVPVPILMSIVRRDEPRLVFASFALMATFVVCYLWFIFFPVAGPYYEYVRPDAWFTANGPARAVYGVLERGSSYGAAFPSSHVAATWVAAAMTWPASRPVGGALIVAAGLLTVGVVYCQMHYGIDALAGVIVAAMVVSATRWIFTSAGRTVPGN